MPLDAHIIDSETELIDPELSAEIGMEDHHTLFAHPELHDGSFPLLARLSDYYADAGFTTGELAALLAEVERATLLVGPDHTVSRFLGPFHSVCCLARLRGKQVAVYAD